MRELIKLTNWEMQGYWPFVPQYLQSAETGMPLMGVTDWISAEVPGSVYRDLLRAGEIKDPYYERNSLQCEWVANRWWVYRTHFYLTPNPSKEYRLVLTGVDYEASIYLNDIPIGNCKGLYKAFDRDITTFLHSDAENTLLVILKNAPEEMGQIGITEQTETLKTRFGYKWDFGTRLVNLGITGEAYIQEIDAFRMEDQQLVTSPQDDGRWELTVISGVYSRLDGQAEWNAALLYKGQKVASKRVTAELCRGINRIVIRLSVENPVLWWPNGYGTPALYTLRLTIGKNGCADCSKEMYVGFRTREYRLPQGASSGTQPYWLYINQRPIYLKGVNMVPLDHLYGCIDEARYVRLLSQLQAAGVNLIRVWGGGLIESELFYSLCDKFGLMVLQDFPQSSSGINNVPSENPAFLELLQEAAQEAVKVKRNHVCLTFWCGGNELCDEQKRPINFQNSNVAMLKRIVEEQDPGTLMLPTTASGPLEYVDIQKPGLNHDVHGPWTSSGDEEYYTLYNCSDSMLHSEFGSEGMSNLATLKQIFSPDHCKVTTVQKDLVWRHHGEWWDSYQRDSKVFGEFSEEDIKNFILCSQFMQAEGLRYALEANRRRMWRSVGSIIWVANEPWPNVTSNALIDYNGIPKLAYYAMQIAYRPQLAVLEYNKLVYNPGEIFKGRIHLINDKAAAKYQLALHVMSGNQELYNGVYEGFINENAVEVLPEEVAFTMPAETHITVSLELKIGGNVTVSRYVLLLREQDTGVANRSMIGLYIRDGYGEAITEQIIKQQEVSE